MQAEKHNTDIFLNVKRRRTSCEKIDIQFPLSDIPFHGLDIEYPGLDIGFHGLDIEYPGLNIGFHGLDIEYPGLDIGFHGLDVEHPGLDIQFHKEEAAKARASAAKNTNKTGLIRQNAPGQ